ncbi:CD63 antigen [Copidosoma floridanum]|uniref:CD63 antigen n=1 Tax=Copidosoma floridanum TaxID=29053 RepID=UPI0006C9DC8D|nr:CD63 antigen [Copidosoma floridanum]
MIVAVGIVMNSDEFSYFSDLSGCSLTTLSITVGTIVIVIAIFGCYGVLQKSTCMIQTFSLLLSTVLMLQLALIVAAYAMKDNIVKSMKEKFLFTMNQSFKSRKARATMDFLESRLQCCGWDGVDDWVTSYINHDNIKSYYSISKNCKTYYVFYKQGCLEKLVGFMVNYRIWIILAATIIICIQILVIVFAHKLKCLIIKHKMGRDMHQLQT